MLQQVPISRSLDPTGQAFKIDIDIGSELRQRIDQFGMTRLAKAANVSTKSLQRYRKAGTLPDTGAGHRVAYALLLKTSASQVDDGGIKVELPKDVDPTNDFGISDDEAINAKRKADAQLSREKVRKIQLEIAAEERRLIGIEEINAIMLAQARRWREHVDTSRRAIERVASNDCRKIVIDTFDSNMELTRTMLKSQWVKLDHGGYKRTEEEQLNGAA